MLEDLICQSLFIGFCLLLANKTCKVLGIRFFVDENNPHDLDDDELLVTYKKLDGTPDYRYNSFTINKEDLNETHIILK